MLTLSAYKLKDVQQMLGVVRMAIEAGYTAERLTHALEAEIAARGPVTATPANPHRSGAACPTPGCPGRLTPWPHSSRQVGAQVIGCRVCHYSRIEERHAI